jgi:Protein of unknown function (DUF2934)
MMPTQRKTAAVNKPTRRASAPPKPTIARAHDIATIPTEHDIASRAYELFVARGGEHGRDWDDWLSAERELFPVPLDWNARHEPAPK